MSERTVRRRMREAADEMSVDSTIRVAVACVRRGLL
jgi:hypothetical protein